MDAPLKAADLLRPLSPQLLHLLCMLRDQLLLRHCRLLLLHPQLPLQLHPVLQPLSLGLCKLALQLLAAALLLPQLILQQRVYTSH